MRLLFKYLHRDRTVAVHMGPCHNVTDNVFGYIFAKLPLVTALDDECALDTSPGTLVARGNFTYLCSERHCKTEFANPFYLEKKHYLAELASFRSFEAFLQDPLIEDTARYLAEHVSQRMQDWLSRFKTETRWADQPVIGWHLRYGNPSGNNTDKDFEQRNRRGSMQASDEYIAQSLALFNRLAKHMGWTKYKIFLATDTALMQEKVRNFAPERIITRKDTYFHPHAHPLVWTNLYHDNAG